MNGWIDQRNWDRNNAHVSGRNVPKGNLKIPNYIYIPFYYFFQYIFPNGITVFAAHKLPEGSNRKCQRKIVKQEVAKEWGTCGCLSLNQYNKWARWGCIRSLEETEERLGMWDSFGAYRGTREMERPKGAANFGFLIIQIFVKLILIFW